MVSNQQRFSSEHYCYPNCSATLLITRCPYWAGGAEGAAPNHWGHISATTQPFMKKGSYMVHWGSQSKTTTATNRPDLRWFMEWDTMYSQSEVSTEIYDDGSH